MRNSSNAAKLGFAHSANASQATDQANLDANSSKSGDLDNASLAADIAKMYALLKETSEKRGKTQHHPASRKQISRHLGVHQ